MERGIKLLMGFQGQWRAGRKDPQASWALGCEVPAYGISSIPKTIGLEILKTGLEEINRTEHRELRKRRVRKGSAFLLPIFSFDHGLQASSWREEL
jgi:hypothetical protein